MCQECDQMFVYSGEKYGDVPAYRILTAFYEILQFVNSSAEIIII